MRFPYGLWRGPQQEQRTVSKETEVVIPNLEGLSIAVLSFGIFVGIFLWGRYWTAAASAITFTIVAIIGLVLWHPVNRYIVSPQRKIEKLLLEFLLGIHFILLIYTCLLVIFKAWFAEMAVWVDVLMSMTLAFVCGAIPPIYFHIQNVRDPNWPTPRWYAFGDDKDKPEEKMPYGWWDDIGEQRGV